MFGNFDLSYAIQIAVIWHSNQEDKAGNLYILHPLRVMMKMQTIDEKIVAVLHDIVEDTDYTLELVEYTFNEEIANAVDALSKRDGESLIEYLSRVKSNPLALKVKLADIADNMSSERLAKLDQKTQERLTKKYNKALKILKED